MHISLPNFLSAQYYTYYLKEIENWNMHLDFYQVHHLCHTPHSGFRWISMHPGTYCVV